MFIFQGCLEQKPLTEETPDLGKLENPPPSNTCTFPGDANLVSIPQGNSCFKRIASREINEVVTDELGNIYIATRNGLSISRDGGSSFETKTYEHGLPNDRIVHVSVIDGKVYIIAHNSIGYVMVSEDRGESFKHLFKLSSSTKLTKVKNNFIVASNGRGICQVNRAEDLSFLEPKCTSLLDAFGDTTSSIHDLYTNSKDEVFVATENGLFISKNDAESYTKKVLVTNLAIEKVRSIKRFNQKLYISIRDNLMVSEDDGESFSAIALPSLITASDKVYDFVVTPNNAIYL